MLMKLTLGVSGGQKNNAPNSAERIFSCYLYMCSVGVPFKCFYALKTIFSQYFIFLRPSSNFGAQAAARPTSASLRHELTLVVKASIHQQS